MKPLIRKTALALAAAAGLSSAQAGVLTYQDVVFTTTWANNVLTLEIDAAQHSGDWSRAITIGALSIKEIGSFQSVQVTAAPKGVELWKMSARELTANGCSGGGGKNREKTSLCLTGTPVALMDNMVFSFAFTGAPDLDEPHLKVNFLDASNNKIGDLLSKTIASTPVVVAQPVTPPPVVTPPVVTPPVVTPPVVTPPAVTPPVTEPVVTQPVVNESVIPPATTPVSSNTSENTGLPAGSGVVDSPVPPPSMGTTAPVVVLEPVSQTHETSEVPEPGAIALLLGGLALMGLALRKRG